MSSDPRGSLERFLRGRQEIPAVATLRRAGLAAYAYGRVGEDDERAAPLRLAYLEATARHLHMTATVLALLRAWRGAGIQPLVFKGMHLATFVYDRSANRPYHDVDVLLAHDDLAEARRVAEASGWSVRWARAASLYDANHEEYVIEREGVVMEIHRWILDQNHPYDAVQRRITHAVWEGSVERTWNDVAVRVPALVDGLLAGLVLARSWSKADDWHLKPSDYLDLVQAREREGVTREDLIRRAEAWGVQRSLTLFLARCDPWRDTLDLRPPTRAQRASWMVLVTSERGHLGWERLRGKIRRFPGTLLDAARSVPRVVRWAVALTREPRMAPHLAKIQEHSETAGATGGVARLDDALRRKERLVRGVKWSARWVLPATDPCRVRALALFEAFVQEGVPVTLVETLDDGARPRRHARVESAWSLRDLEAVSDCAHGTEVARYEACAAGTPEQLADAPTAFDASGRTT